jgi:DNA-binding transcriptional MerR regulator
MDEQFTSQHIIKTFKVSHQTIKNWCDEFAKYLSPTARPGDGKKRFFTADDLKVLSLVHEYHKRGFRWEDAHVALQSGQRGDIPDTSELVPYENPTAMLALKEEVKNLRLLLEASQSERNMEHGKVELLEKQLAQKEALIKELYREVAILEAQKGQG